MKKSLKFSAAVAGLFIIGGAGLYMGRNALIRSAVETAAPRILKTSVTLGQVDFRPFQGHLTLKNLHIANPAGFSKKELFDLGTISVDLRPGTLLSKKIVIDKILIDKVSARYEIANGTNNIAVLQKNVSGDPAPKAKEKTPAAGKTKTAGKTADEKTAKTVVIKDLTVKDAKVAASVSGMGITLPLPTIHMTGIGEDKPSTFKEVVKSVLNVFSTETLSSLANGTGEAVKSGAGSLKQILQKLF